MFPCTLATVANDPSSVSYTLQSRSDDTVQLRPLLHGDVNALEKFMEDLSVQTKAFSTYDCTAQEMCEAINKYDKLRFITLVNDSVTSLLEFSFAILESDIERFQSYNITLNEEID